MQVRAYKASQPTYQHPIIMQAGDRLERVGDEDEGWGWFKHQSGSEGWVPLSWISEGIALKTYNGTELPVAEGEIFTAHSLTCGWLWCSNSQGELGWVRASQVESI